MSLKNIIRGLGFEVILLVVFAGIMLYQAVPEVVVSLKPAVSYEDMLEEGATVKAGDHVSGEVCYVLDYFATESTYTQRSDGTRSGDKASGRYYLLPTADNFIALKCRQADVAALEQLADETWAYMTDGTEPTTEFAMEGRVDVLEPQLAGYYREYLADMGYTEEELDAMGDPLVVQYVSFTACWVMTGIGLVLVLVAVLLFRRRYHIAVYGSGRPKAEDLPDLQ